MIDCTLLFQHLSTVKVSPNGQYLAENTPKGVVIRNTQTFAIQAERLLGWKSDKIKWAPDSSLILCWFEQSLIRR